MRTFIPVTHAVLFAVFLSAALPRVYADSRDDAIGALREKINELDRQLRLLEREQTLGADQPETAIKNAPRVTINDRGLTVVSGDGADELRFRGLVQFDSRWYFKGSGEGKDGFVLRRARTIIEGTFDRIYSFQIVPEYAGTSFSLLDANLSIRLSKRLTIRAGKFKSPVGLEQLQSDSSAFFAERSLASGLTPNRDLGIELNGNAGRSGLRYEIGVFNGEPDAASSSNADVNDGKAVIARVFAEPFDTNAGSPLKGLGVGLAGSYGREKTAGGITSGYKTDGAQTFFKYRAEVVADGAAWRYSPQAYYYHGPFGALSEYVVSTINARPNGGAAKSELTNKAWHLAVGYVLTGEEATFTGVVPKTRFDPASGGWGAWQVVARYARLDIDGDAFPLFADPAVSASKAEAFGAGINWYLSPAVRATVDYFQTRFTRGAAVPSSSLLRQDEKAVVTRFQVTF